MIELILSGFVLALLLVVLRRYVRPSAFSPVYGLIAIYLMIFTLSVLFYDPTAGGTSIRLMMSMEDDIALLTNVGWILSCFVLGCLVYVSFRARGGALRRRMAELTQVRLSPMQTAAILLLTVTCITVTILATGIQNLWSRPEYMIPGNHGLATVAGLMSLVCAFLLGVAVAQPGKWVTRISIALMLTLLVLMASLATRRLAVLPVLFSLGTIVGNARNPRFRRLLWATALFTPLLTAIPLVMRGMPTKGIAAFPDIPAGIANQDVIQRSGETVNNLLVAGPITVESSKPIPDQLDYLLLSLNPLPGIWVGWYSAFKNINQATPFNAVGELLRGGPWTAAMYYFAVGVLFARLEGLLRKVQRVNPGLLILLTLAFGFTLTSLQYSLRATTRFLYYMIVFECLVRLSSTLSSAKGRTPANLTKAQVKRFHYQLPGQRWARLILKNSN